MKVSGHEIKCMDCECEHFPQQLLNIKDPPERLYYAGDLSALDRPTAAIVGSRKFTVYGKTVSRMLGERLGEAGVSVVSGLAYGIDSFAHQGVIDAGGKAVAVLGGGLLRMSPRKNYQLMEDILNSGGLVVSEYEPDYPPQAWTYPRRNRIISGLSRIVCVVEANFNSGALITAQHAMEQGRQVYAVPGNINSQFSMGSNLLIRDGASPLVVMDDLIRDMGLDVTINEAASPNLGEDERMLLEVVKRYNGASVDTVAREANRRIQSVNAILTVMEVKGYVWSCGGKYYTNM
ncbi:MAG: DNA-protecting protein DprA [Parasporobacterium sp.]|nr:DNA-protecting protein DprA [Parasporobacterium sp.]